MALKCGIVGLPNVGKSTLFNCLSNAKAQSANFPFCTIEPNLGTISVPDNRLTELEGLVNPERVMPTTIEIVDITGKRILQSNFDGIENERLFEHRTLTIQPYYPYSHHLQQYIPNFHKSEPIPNLRSPRLGVLDYR